MLVSITTQMQLPIELIICSSQSFIYKEIERCWIGKHNCPCCSYILLPHINSQGIYWYCRHCHQEMPVLEDEIEKRRKETVPEFYLNVSIRLPLYFSTKTNQQLTVKG